MSNQTLSIFSFTFSGWVSFYHWVLIPCMKCEHFGKDRLLPLSKASPYRQLLDLYAAYKISKKYLDEVKCVYLLKCWFSCIFLKTSLPPYLSTTRFPQSQLRVILLRCSFLSYSVSFAVSVPYLRESAIFLSLTSKNADLVLKPCSSSFHVTGLSMPEMFLYWASLLQSACFYHSPIWNFL